MTEKQLHQIAPACTSRVVQGSTARRIGLGPGWIGPALEQQLHDWGVPGSHGYREQSVPARRNLTNASGIVVQQGSQASDLALLHSNDNVRFRIVSFGHQRLPSQERPQAGASLSFCARSSDLIEVGVYAENDPDQLSLMATTGSSWAARRAGR
jgi:hypothetical protein